MSDRNVALALSRSGLSSPARTRAAIARVEVEQRAHRVTDVPARRAPRRTCPRASAISSRSGGSPVRRAGRPAVVGPGERRVEHRLGRLAGREAACRLAERLDRELGAGREAGAPAVDPDGHAAQPRDGRRARRRGRGSSAVWLSTPRTNDAVGQHRLEVPQPPLAHVAEAGVVVAALGVVVVGDDGRAQAGRRAEQVEPLEPVRVVADLVDLVDRDRDDAQGERGRARHRHDAAVGELLGERVRDRTVPAHWRSA